MGRLCQYHRRRQLNPRPRTRQSDPSQLNVDLAHRRSSNPTLRPVQPRLLLVPNRPLLPFPPLPIGSTSSDSSPTQTKVSALLFAAARHRSRHLDRAVRYLLDSDIQPDRCADPIWLLEVVHPEYEPAGGVPVVVVVGGGLGKRRSSVSVDPDGSTGVSWVARRAPSAYSYRGPPPARLCCPSLH